jgi:hypothetical protein
MKTKNKKKAKVVKMSCGKKGCYITLLPTLILRERLEEYKKAS